MKYDYFYANKDSKLLRYIDHHIVCDGYFLPITLFTDHDLDHLTIYARALYGFLLDPVPDSKAAHHFDKGGRLYVCVPLYKMANYLNCCISKVVTTLAELEVAGLIKRSKERSERTARTYMKDISAPLQEGRENH